jgi:hypothetical protein
VAALRYCCAIAFLEVSGFQELPHEAITPQYHCSFIASLSHNSALYTSQCVLFLSGHPQPSSKQLHMSVSSCTYPVDAVKINKSKSRHRPEQFPYCKLLFPQSCCHLNETSLISMWFHLICSEFHLIIRKSEEEGKFLT